MNRRFSWFAGDRLKAAQRLPALAALTKASNWQGAAHENRLIQAFRKFEEHSVLDIEKIGKHQNITIADARRVQWTLVYATYQVLRSVAPAQDQEEEFDLSYHLPVESDYTFPWEGLSYVENGIDFGETPALSPDIVWGDGNIDTAGKIEIKPDIDYLGISHRNSIRMLTGELQLSNSEPIFVPPTRAKSLSRVLNRSSTLRKSLRKLRPSTASSQKTASTMNNAYHEIVIQGYGNGTNGVNIVPAATRPALDLSMSWPSRTDSTTSQAKSAMYSTPDSESTGDGLDAPDTPITLPSPPLWGFEDQVAPDAVAPEEQPKQDCNRSGSKRRKVVSMIAPTLRRPLSNPALPKRRPLSQIFHSKDYVDAWEELSKENQAPPQPRPPSGLDKPNGGGGFFSLSRSMSVRPTSILTDFRRKSHTGILDTEFEVSEELYTPTRPSEDWAAMQAFLDGDEGRTETIAVPAWEQYAELGGLTDVR